MNPEALTIEALPAIIILSAFLLVMFKIFVINHFIMMKETKEEKSKKGNGKECTESGKCTI
ncbi:MAG: hypothetical protein PHW47_05985 [Lachnospira sp.]|nr:hypothetical protein [Lachnospira sp.]